MTAEGPTGSLVFATERDGDGFATCCGMVRELDGSCAHRSHHPVYVDDGPAGTALRAVRDLHKPQRVDLTRSHGDRPSSRYIGCDVCDNDGVPTDWPCYTVSPMVQGSVRWVYASPRGPSNVMPS